MDKSSQNDLDAALRQAVRDLMKDTGLTQERVAAALGIRQGRVSNMLSGHEAKLLAWHVHAIEALTGVRPGESNRRALRILAGMAPGEPWPEPVPYDKADVLRRLERLEAAQGGHADIDYALAAESGEDPTGIEMGPIVQGPSPHDNHENWGA